MKQGKTDRPQKKRGPEKGARTAAAARTLKKVLVFAAAAAALVAAVHFLPHRMPTVLAMETVVLEGNDHLTDGELMQIAGVKGNEDMLALSGRKVYDRLRNSPWIQQASVRKEYPSRLVIRIRETEPFALLDMKGKMFIVDEHGRMLEELRENSVPFLPVITSDPYGEKNAYREAVALAKAIKTMGMLHQSQRIEIIAHSPNEIATNLDGVIVKVGAGDYEDKLKRLLEMEQEIKNRGIRVAYIDLRFANKVIVKPVNEVIR